MSNASQNVNRDYVLDVTKALQTIWKPQSIDLPAFADDTNSKLHDDIKNYSKQINQLISELMEMDAHCINIQNHKNIVLKELANAQQLMDAKQREVDTEVHLTNLYERDIGRMRQKAAETRSTTRQVNDRKQQLQTQLLRQNAQMTEMIKEQQALLDEQAEWKLAQQQKAEDQFAIQKYRAVDDKQLQELNQAADRQLKILHQLQSQLNQHINDTQTIQIQLDKSAEQYQTLQQNRERALQQFEDALRILEQREKQEADSEQIRDKLIMEVNLLKQQDRELQQEIDREEREKQNAIHDYDGVEREVQLAQQEFDKAVQDETDLQGEILVNQGQLQNLMRQIQGAKNSLKSVNEQKAARQAALDQVNRRIDLFNAAEEKMKENKLELDELIRTEQEALDGLQAELGKWNAVLDAATADMQSAGKNLNDLKQEEFNLKSSISSYQAGLRGLEARINQMENQLQQQRRHIYNADFQIQALTRKLSHVRGDVSAEEQLVLKRNIEVLQNQLAIETRGIQLVKQQTGSVLAEIGRVKRQLADARAQKQRVENSLNELVLASQTTVTAVKNSQDEKEEQLLQLDKLKITRDQVMKEFTKQISILFGLQNRSKQIDLQQQSEAKQLEATRAVLQNELRLLRDEAHVQRLELKHRRIAQSKLECRADVLVAKVASKAKQAQGDSTQEADPRTAQADAIIQFSKRRTDLYQKLAYLKQVEHKVRLEKKGLKQALVALQQSNTKVRKLGRPAEKEDQEKLANQKAKLAQIESQMFYYVNQTRQAMQRLEELGGQNDILREEQDRLAVQYEGARYGDEGGL